MKYITLIAVLFACLMFFSGFITVSGYGSLQPHSIHTSNTFSQETGVNLNFRHQIGARNSGVTVPIYQIGNRMKNGTNLKMIPFSSSSQLAGSDGSIYFIHKGTLIVNRTINISSRYFIGYSIEIKHGAVLTLYHDILSEQMYFKANRKVFHKAYNNYSMGQLILSGDVIRGYKMPSYDYEDPIYANYLNNSFICGYVSIDILNGKYDTFKGNAILGINGTVTNSKFAYMNGSGEKGILISAGKGHARIEYSYFEGVHGHFNSNRRLMNISHSTISYDAKYVYNDLMGKSQLREENVNLSFDRIVHSGKHSHAGLFPFIYSRYFNDYYNFTIPSSLWSNHKKVDKIVNYSLGQNPRRYRGSTNLNNSLFPVVMKNNDFSGLQGIELYGTGRTYIENNLFTEQLFWTAFIDMFHGHHVSLRNSVISNNTFHYYSDIHLENIIAKNIKQGGGNTYITSGEYGNLLTNVTVKYNTFKGCLGTVYKNRVQHASFILGAYSSVHNNLFNVTGVANQGARIAAPNMEIDEYQRSGISMIYCNEFTGLSRNTVAISLVHIHHTSTYGTVELCRNEFEGNKSTYQITAFAGYNIDFIKQNGKEYFQLSGTITMYDGQTGNGYLANTYTLTSATVTHYSKSRLTIDETCLPDGTTWFVNLSNGIRSGPIETSFYAINLKNGTYSYSVTTVDKIYHSEYGTISIKGESIFIGAGFHKQTYKLEISGSGLPKGLRWYIRNKSEIENATSPLNITVYLTNGSYTFAIISPTGYYNKTQFLYVVINGKNLKKIVTFVPFPSQRNSFSIIDLYPIIVLIVIFAEIAGITVLYRKGKRK